MKTEELASLPKEDDILIQVEQFKTGLISRATGGGFEDSEYRRLRKLILSIPELEDYMPSFLKICRTADDFWSWIKCEAPTYAERRQIISTELNPILEVLEYESSEGSLEFKRNYVEKGIIGTGGYGQVYLFEHKLLGLPFAIKVFSPAFYKGGDKEIERFFQEARMLFKLQHQSIIRIYDAGLMGKRPFIRMEYFEGLNLNQILDKHGIICPKRAIIFMRKITDAISFAHETVGIIHRDLKPSNVMAARRNQFRIIDFGLSIFIENELHSRLTGTGESSVSGYYTAPELVESPKLIDKRSDIYSLGALWYTMLTGHPPAGTSISTRLNQIDGMSDDNIQAIEKCLSDIDHRFQSCEELLQKFDEIDKENVI